MNKEIIRELGMEIPENFINNHVFYKWINILFKKEKLSKEEYNNLIKMLDSSDKENLSLVKIILYNKSEY